MRAGACTVQQTLTSEAASVLKLSLSLARRRGHAQATPLHVAATLLTSRASLLRRACLKSQPHPPSHPLQCRALELCFNVALNRLPTTPGPLLQAHQPSLSNALIAALKRAQAHQRRGCIEQQQQQPLLAIKVELEQLIISILDDPSVSRVMREAGFSSTCVKSNVEESSSSLTSSVFQCYSSGGILSSPPSVESRRETVRSGSFWPTHILNSPPEQGPPLFSAQRKQISSHFVDLGGERKDDLRVVLEVLLRKKRRNAIIVGDCPSTAEGLLMELMGKVERGEVPEELGAVHFIRFQLSPVALRFMKRDDVEMKVVELRRKTGPAVLAGGAIIYVGDLKWVVEESYAEKDSVPGLGVPGYSPVEHVIGEIGRLLSDFNGKVWLMATANYQTYMRSQMRTPPLEIQWSLQAVAVPSGGLALSLHSSSGMDGRAPLSQNLSQRLESNHFNAKEELEPLVCCAECASNFEKEAGIFKSAQQKSPSFLSSGDDRGSNHLPYWLQEHRPENHHKDVLLELRRKWNRLCQSLHHHPRHNQIQPNPSLFNQNCKSHAYAPPYPWWPASLQFMQTNSFADSNSISFAELVSKPGTNSNFMAQLKNQPSWSVENGIGGGGNHQELSTPENHPSRLSLDSLKKTQNKDLRITLALGNPLFSDSATSPVWRRETIDPRDLRRDLLENIPWQSEIVPAIVDALLDFRPGWKKGIWLLIQGNDWIGKRRFAQAVAESLYGSTDSLVHMNLKNIRENKISSSAKILIDALRNDTNRVVLLEEMDHADPEFVKFLADGYKNGKFKDPSGQEVAACAVFIMTRGGSTDFDGNGEKPNSVIQMKLHFEEKQPDSIASNGYKRKGDQELQNESKHPRTGVKEEEPLIIVEVEIEKKPFSRQSSITTLDLNICAEDDGDDGESNAIPSDLTQESVADLHIPHGFFELIENRFIFDRNPVRSSRISENFRSKLEESFQSALGGKRRGIFCVDEGVLEELVVASASFVESLFEKWLKDVFQTSLATVDWKKGGKEVWVVRMSVEGKIGNLEFGFEGSNLPKRISVD
ncbi:protein SMAX1-LIKE 4-like [Magnolia sinica]|uniref:protein SMAX1-LIKE 4-like n=1 Tax=Magnolia sinica TaxID=86752 RepID=UPI00265A8357|nr:protein SMAX1-LIKE 4-like [Magnolia sinica]